MYAVLKSFGLKGLNGFPVEVEADISGGMPAKKYAGEPNIDPSETRAISTLPTVKLVTGMETSDTGLMLP